MLSAPTARNVIAWGNGPGEGQRLGKRWRREIETVNRKTAVGKLRLRLFRACSARKRRLVLPGPMAQATTSRAVGAERGLFNNELGASGSVTRGRKRIHGTHSLSGTKHHPGQL